MTSEPAVELDGVEHAYRRSTALRGVTMRVETGETGEIVAVTGPSGSGSGKSTVLHTAAGILTPDGGRVRVLGRDLGELRETGRARMRRREIGVVLQFGQLVPDLPVLDNVALPLLLDGHHRDPAREQAREWLHRVELADQADADPAELSGGQAQRAAVARALVTGPALVLAASPPAAPTAGPARCCSTCWSGRCGNATRRCCWSPTTTPSPPSPAARPSGAAARPPSAASRVDGTHPTIAGSAARRRRPGAGADGGRGHRGPRRVARRVAGRTGLPAPLGASGSASPIRDAAAADT